MPSQNRTPAPAPADDQPRLYTDWASWWPLVSDPADFEDEAACYTELLCQAARGPCRTLLELGSGAGNNAFHMRRHFEMTLVDRSPQMLALSRARQPDCRHVQGDMRDLRLDATFDVVFLHDAVIYMTGTAELARVLETAAAHCRPGGLLLVVPDHTRETFVETSGHGGVSEGARGARYLQWSWDPDPADTTYLTQFVLILRGEDGSVRVEQEQHTCGLFTRATWRRLLRAAGFDPHRVRVQFDGIESGCCEAFLGRRQGSRGG